MAREITLNTAHHFNWVNIAAGINHPEQGKRIDISEDTNNRIGITDSNIVLYPSHGYGNTEMIRQVIELEKPDAVMLFTDPRHYEHVWRMENEIRHKIPIIYYSIWDSTPTPIWNTPYYESCDTLISISKQTDNIHKMLVDDKIFKYVPHGTNPKTYFPVDKNDVDFINFKNHIFKGKQYEFVVFFNSRNIRRKNPSDLILAYRHFVDQLSKEQAKKCVLVMHTQPKDENGTDLVAVAEALCDPSYCNVIFSNQQLDSKYLNYLYNMADITALISSAEGFGLSMLESMMAGTMILGNVTGGIQDQMRFEDEEGKWLNFSPTFLSNHYGTYKKHGKWALSVYPTALSLVGSIPTPYIFDDRCDFKDVSDQLLISFFLNPQERIERGLAGREWVMGEEAKMTSENMGKGITEAIDETLATWKPISSHTLTKVKALEPNYLKHPLVY